MGKGWGGNKLTVWQFLHFLIGQIWWVEFGEGIALGDHFGILQTRSVLYRLRVFCPKKKAVKLTLSALLALSTSKPFSSIQRCLRFHSNVSGNCTFTSPISTDEKAGLMVSRLGSWCSTIGSSLISFRTGLNAEAMLLLEAAEIFDMRLNRRLFLDSFLLSSLEPSKFVRLLREVSLMECGSSGSLPRRLSVEDRRFEMEFRRGAGNGSLFWALLVDDMDRE